MPFLKPQNYSLPRSRVLENLSKRNGLRHTIYNGVGDKYIGEWKNDKKTGKGVILTRNSELYEGDMKENYRHGFGVLAQRIPNTDVFRLLYRGDWRYGKMDGNGLRIYPDGSYYIGEFKKGKRQGHGQQWYPVGAFFDGIFINDLKNGMGVMIQANGNRYEGEWANDLKHGRGQFFHLDSGQMQDGIWKENLCIFSQIRDIAFRQCCIAPTPYSIPNVSRFAKIL
ncbi:hypothetical protein ABEB36_011648 [Hypothenemus hampei]|uniref:MORN repeat-containing protein 3 n=1 Tax=Hypothenemus hampei TaxID=57062 RepID=A0ABD1E8K4_HYPHA